MFNQSEPKLKQFAAIAPHLLLLNQFMLFLSVVSSVPNTILESQAS
jgi:hypothetical protein